MTNDGNLLKDYFVLRTRCTVYDASHDRLYDTSSAVSCMELDSASLTDEGLGEKRASIKLQDEKNNMN